MILDVKSNVNIIFCEDSVRERHRIRGGHFPDVDDPIDLFNEAWRITSRKILIKCRMNIKCLSESLCIQEIELHHLPHHLEELIVQFKIRMSVLIHEK